MKKSLFVLALSALLAACGGSDKSTAEMKSDAAFEAYKNGFVEELWKVYPVWASSQGYHKYDSLLFAPDATERERELGFARANLDSLSKFKTDELSSNNQTDYQLINNQLQSIIWNLTVQKAYEWDPSGYNVGECFASMLNNSYDSLDNRLRAFSARASKIPAYYEAAATNIQNPTIEHTQLAIDQNIGASTVFERDLPEALKNSHLSDAEKTELIARSNEAAAAIKKYVQYLKDLKNEHPRSFRLGADLYAKKFDLDLQSRFTPDEIYKRAMEHKTELHADMTRLARKIWPKYFGSTPQPTDSLELIRTVIDKISLNHVQPDSFQTAIEKQLPVLQKFVQDKNLLYIDPAKPLVVRREPDYMAGVAGASISAPGPYDKNGATYYNVGSLSGWDTAKSESYLREYNHYILQILNIHEAIPGHYTQLIYANQSPSLIKSLFGTSSMIEGWAVYTERMMLEAGYGNNEDEMWLMYDKWNLRSTCNTILDYSVHVKSMSKEEAMILLTREAFQQQAEAEGKWRRASVTQTQLCCYFTGYCEIMDLRDELKKKQGDKFDLKKFHEQFLSFGSAPVKYIRELMLKS